MTTTAMTYELPADHPLRKLEARLLEVIKERNDLDRKVSEARAFLSESNTGPTPPDERQLMMSIRRAENRDLAHGTNEAEPLRKKLDQARADYQAACEEFERKREEAHALILPKTATRGIGTKADEMKAILNREAADIDMLIRQAEMAISAKVLPEAEKRYLQAATEFMHAFYVLAGLKSTQPGWMAIHPPALPGLEVLDRDTFPDYGPANDVAQAFHKGRNAVADVALVREQIIPLAFHGVLPAGVRLTAEPNPRHDPRNPHSDSHTFGIELIVTEQNQETAG